MKSCTLHPPSGAQFSDNAIGSVLIEPTAPSTLYPKRNAHDRGNKFAPASSSERPPAAPHVEDIPGDQDFLAFKAPANDNQYLAITELLMLGQEMERKRQRNNQRRYRKKQDDYEEGLKRSTLDIRSEIKQREQERHTLCLSMSKKASVWSVAVEYFRLFSHGLRWTSLQSSFVQSVMAPDVVINAGRVEKHLMHSWWCLSIWFDDVVVELEEVQSAGREDVLATTTTSFTITERTLWTVFPHVCGGEMSFLASKLVNQRVVVRSWTRFEWDSACHRVTSIMAEGDLLTPMLNLLGSLEDVSRLFEKSLVSPTFQLRQQYGVGYGAPTNETR